jgi:V/A-type H+-transporting ATPase subunit D
MSKLKYTKNELKKQKDDLKRFTRYLPTLTLKKQQLQLEITKAAHVIKEIEEKIEKLTISTNRWVEVFAEDVDIRNLARIEKIHTIEENIAGIDIPVFDRADFKQERYDFARAPLWVDFGIEAIKKVSNLNIQTALLRKKRALLTEELRITAQRVNLFEKIMIPQSYENIRKINIVLGDMQTAAVVTGKIAKRKIEQKYIVV